MQMSLVLVGVVLPALVHSLGEPVDQPVENLTAEQRGIVDFAFSQLEGGSAACPRKVAKVTRFQSQVVAGTKYIFDIELATDKKAGCPAAPVEKCHMEVWERPWENFKEVQWKAVTCTRNGLQSEDETSSEEDEDEVDNSSPSVDDDSSEEEVTTSATTGRPRKLLLRIPLSGSQPAAGPVSRLLNQFQSRIAILGGGDHDYVPHNENILGGGDHDYVPHNNKNILGGGDHDYVPHTKNLLGGGDHDYVPHNNKNILGGGDHDYVPHETVNGVRQWPNYETSKKDLAKLQSLDSFHSFMAAHNKKYQDKKQYKLRYKIFRENMKKVQFLRNTEQGTGIYGATAQADLSESEFRAHFLGLDRARDDPDVHWPPADIPDVELPSEFDWRTKGAITPVKNQGQCGSCWAFSVTGNVEGLYAIKSGELVSLSEQELVDCDTRDSGCNGGLPENAYKTLLEIGGLESEAEYGYDGEDEQCKFNRSRVVARVSGGVEISQNETQMAQWLTQNGPISVGLNANAMQFYMGGVSHPFKFLCSADGIDHGVLIVGFGVKEYPLFHKTYPYWIIKNSWGPSWGEQGYYRLYRGDGTCGINMMTSSAVLE